MEIERRKELNLLHNRLRTSKVVAILGPRQCGKTTLAHQLARRLPHPQVHFFDLEDPQDLARLENPLLALEDLAGTIIIDEIQRRPDLFPILRVLADRKSSSRFLILGSASRDLIAQSSETLAGRISFIELGGFSLNILPKQDLQKLWIRGGFPRSFLARNEEGSFQWRKDFISTFLERDIPNLGLHIPPQTIRRFWIMLSHYHGQIFNASVLGRNFGMADTTIKRYVDLLSGTFMVRQLSPWFGNSKKRLVKRPKIYLRDSGIFHTLQSISTQKDLRNHPKLGSSWEGFALEQVIQHLSLREDEVFFWAAHTGAELDLLIMKKGKLWGIEFKYSDSPSRTKSMLSAIQELSLAQLWVITPGKKSYPLDNKITVVPLQNLSNIKI